MSTVHIQTRLAASIVDRIDSIAAERNITRSEALRELVEEALVGPKPLPEPDPLLDQVATGVGALLAKYDEMLAACRNANLNAEHAYMNARLHARLALPADRWQAFVSELEKRA